MTHSEKIERWLAYAKENNFKKSVYAPPLDRFLQWRQIEQPPIIFWSYSKLTICFGLFFAITMGLVDLFTTRYDRLPLTTLIIVSTISSSFFGLSMALFFNLRKRKLNLPKWEEFGSSRENSGTEFRS